MSNEFIAKHQGELDGAIEHFQKELNGLKVGRANPAMVENLLVDAYGVKTPLRQVASIAVPEARMLTIEPWDKNLLKEVEKAVVQANLGLGVSGESTLVRVTVPQLTEENRRDLAKILSGKLEDGKIAIKAVREKIKDEITEAFKTSDITEDDKYAYVEELDKLVSETNRKLQDMAENKEKEIMNI